MKNIYFIVILSLTQTLSGCQKEKDTDGSSSSSNSTSSSSSSSSSSSGDSLASYTNHVQGNHPLLTNTKIEDMIVDLSVIAGLHELLTLGVQKKWDDFISQSQAVGFDKEQFDIIYDATIATVKSIHNFATSDMTFGIFIGEPNPTYMKGLSITSTIEPGLQGRDKKLSYSVLGQVSLPSCTMGEQSCTVDIDIEFFLYFPTRNPGFLPDAENRALDFAYEDMHIQFTRFKISNALANLQINPSTQSNLALSFGSTAFENQSNENNDPKTAAVTPTRLTTLGPGPLGGEAPIEESTDLWHTQSWSTTNQNTINLQGVFTNNYLDDNGDIQQISIQANLLGAIGVFEFAANGGFEVLPDRAISIVERFSLFEMDNNVSDYATFAPGTISGYTEGADLMVNFTTEAVE